MPATPGSLLGLAADQNRQESGFAVSILIYPCRFSLKVYYLPQLLEIGLELGLRFVLVTLVYEKGPRYFGERIEPSQICPHGQIGNHTSVKLRSQERLKVGLDVSSATQSYAGG